MGKSTLSISISVKLKKESQNTTFSILEILEKRWSPRQFSKKSISLSNINQLFEAARWASSSFNEQPWRFIVGKENDKTYREIFSTLMPANQTWLSDTPLLVLSLAKKTFTMNNQPNRHAWHDVGLAVNNMILQAVDLNIFAHQMAGFYVEKAIEIFKIPSDFEPVSITAFGYLETDSATQDKYLEQKNQRKRNLQEIFVFDKSPWIA